MKRLLLIALLALSLPAFGLPDRFESDARWQCLERQVAELATHPELLAAVNNYNASPPNPHKLDAIWTQLALHDPILKRIIEIPAAEVMRQWITQVSIQGEGLLIGNNGGLVAATEKTTDFWQGDEAQFLQAIMIPKGFAFVQAEMLDESTNLMLIKVSSPIYNPRAKRAVGVLVIGFDQFVIDFIQPCKKTD